LDPWYGYPYPYPWLYPPIPGAIVADWATSGIKLDVTPKDASVYVDGYYCGSVESYSGFFRQLTLSAGPHAVEIRKAGYRPLVLEVNLQPGQTIRYKRTMEPVGPGAAAEPEPPVLSEGASVDPEGFIQTPGDIRFDIEPADAEVYADGYYAGLADDFSGGAQRLVLSPGPHHIELRADGYEPAEFDVRIQPGQTVNYRTNLRRSR
jgi:hypothetical protein